MVLEGGRRGGTVSRLLFQIQSKDFFHIESSRIVYQELLIHSYAFVCW